MGSQTSENLPLTCLFDQNNCRVMAIASARCPHVAAASWNNRDTTVPKIFMTKSLSHGFLVTIICEAVLQDRLVHLLSQLGASGYTIIPAKGAGSHGRRMGDIAGYNTNIEVKTIVTSEISDQLLEDVKELQSNHALIAFRQKVEGLFD